MSDLKHRIESILFSAGKQITLEELSRLTKERDPEKIREAIRELKKDLEDKQGSIMLIEEGDSWKLTVREKYLPFVRKVVSKTELPKTVIETLAIVAFKAPVLQSKVIHIRTNKAYKHLDYLEEKGYITREKKGRTKLIKLTQKFFEYFDVPPEKLKEKFTGFKELDKAIEEVETPKEVDLVDSEGHKQKLEEYSREKQVEEYEETPSPVEPFVETVDGLEVYGEKKERKEKPKKKPKKKKEKKKEEEKKEPEEKFEPPSEEELAAALTGEEIEEAEKEEIAEKAEKAEEVAEKVEEVAEEAKEEAEEVKEEVEEKEEVKEEKPEKKPKKKKEKKPKKKKKKKEEVKEEEPEKRIKVSEVHKKAKERAAAMEESPTEYKAKGIFKGEIPEELKEKISKRAEEIVYGEKPEIEEEKKEEIEAEEKPELPKEEPKPEIEKKKKEELPKEE
ncbi:SMC-Scp complex subunit ScpB [Candidatus Woesearchaeota archaeon]|nr:SMC-Scp complex subunit ScpB [Candidatus Woesearchaeota archaeon]